MSEPGDQVRRHGLLASAIAKRRTEVTLAEAGAASWTDGLTIYVDPSLSAAESLQAVVVQAALIAADSLSPDVLSVLRRRTELTARYLSVEGRRALYQLRPVLPSAATALLGTASPASATPAESLAIATGTVPIEAPPTVFGQIRPRAVRVPAVALSGGEADRALPGQPVALADVDDAADLDELDRTAAEDLSSPVGGGGAVGRLLQRLTAAVRSRDAGSPGADAATHAARRGSAAGRRTGTVTGGSQITDADELLARAARTYPEWDCHRSAYRPDWCSVRERAAVVGPHPLTIRPSRALRRSLGRVMPDLARVHRQLQGDDVDIDAVVSEQVNLAAGVTADEAVYVDSIRRMRDLAVLILLDVSASSAEPSATRESVHEHQVVTAASLAVALHELGDRVAVDAFRSMGRDNVEIVPLKRFAEPADVTMLRRFAAVTPGAYTRLGAAIRHGAATVDHEAGTARRLLIVVSDGFAYDHGYEGRYGEADARRALAEARRTGVGCLCLSVGGVTPAAALTRVFGTAAHASIDDLQALPTVVARLFPAALNSADQRRRSWQHRSRSRARQQLDRRTA